MATSFVFNASSATPAGLHVGVLGTDKLVHLTQFAKLKWFTAPPAPVELVSAPTLVSFSWAVFAFALGVNRKIYYAVLATTGAWSGWGTIAEGEFADTPAAAVLRGQLVLVARGTNDKIYYNTLAQTWGTWLEVPGDVRSLSSPAAAVLDDQLHVMVRSTNDKVFATIMAGDKWQAWGEVAGGGATDAAPAVAVFNHALHVVVKGADKKLYGQVRAAAGNWVAGSWTELGGKGAAVAAPALGVHGSELIAVVQGMDGKLYYNRMNAGGAWSSWAAGPGDGVVHSHPTATVVA